MIHLFLIGIAGGIILALVTGLIKPKYVREMLDRPQINPWLKQKELPFDKNLAAIGVLQPEIVETIDWSKWDEFNPPEEVVQRPADFDEIWEMGREHPAMWVESRTGKPVECKWYKDPPTKTELRWRNTLAEPELPQPGRATLCLLDHKHNVNCAPIPRGESEFCL